MWKYLTDWACPIKRWVIVDGPLATVDLSFMYLIVFTDFTEYATAANQIVAFAAGCAAVTLTVVRIVNELKNKKKP